MRTPTSPLRKAAKIVWGGVVALMVAWARPATAQNLGVFRWQLQPYCNVVTVNVAQSGAVYTLDGYDDQCGAPARAPLVGLATPNPDGTIGLGLHIVTVPGGRAVSVDARISLATLGGSWTDSAGNTGTAVFNGAASGSPRPAPTIPAGAIAPGSISVSHLAPGVTAAIAATVGSCASGQYLRGVRADGAAICEAVVVPPSTVDVVAGAIGDTSIAIGRDGVPIVAFTGTGEQLHIAKCLHATCATAMTYPLVATNGSGITPRLAIGADGLPVVAHFDRNGPGLRVSHCNDPDCRTVTSTLVVTGSGVSFNAMAIGADGLPILAHQQAATDLRVTHCENVVCTVSRTFTVDAVGTSGWDPAMTIGADGFAIIAHYDTANGDLRVTHCVNIDCSGATSRTVDATGNLGFDAAIMIGADQRPLIAHSDLTSNGVRLTHCDDATCSASTSITLPQGQDPTLVAAPGGVPTLTFYRRFVDFEVMFGRCADERCGNAQAGLLPTGAPSGRGLSMAIDRDGLAAIAHRNPVTGQLRVTRCGTVTCR
jgi:hypothetical protein